MNDQRGRQGLEDMKRNKREGGGRRDGTRER